MAVTEVREFFRDLIVPAFRDAPWLTAAVLVGVTLLLILRAVSFLGG